MLEFVDILLPADVFSKGVEDIDSHLVVSVPL